MNPSISSRRREGAALQDLPLPRLALAAFSAGVLLGLGRGLFRSYRFSDKVVVITGGSRGLGLVLARRLARQGARLALCARNGRELALAREELGALGAEVLTLPCDVGDWEQVRSMAQLVRARFGRVDVLINNAGIIQVGPAESMGLADYRESMRTTFWGAVHCTLALLPLMSGARRARIVNITSIGGTVPVPHLLPYTCAKFATVGFSTGLRAELAKRGIRVTTIVPGLMRTGSFVQALFKGRRRDEYRLFSLAACAPGLTLSAERAAAKILAACASGRSLVTLGLPWKAVRLAFAAFPGVAGSVMAMVNRFLPGDLPQGTVHEAARSGLAVDPGLHRSGLRRLGARAAELNRELAG